MKVAVFGAGTMGSGIAQVFAQAGNETYLYASSPDSAQRHKDKLAAGLQKRVEKGKMTQEAVDAILNNIKIEEKAACADCDLILETVKENMAVKKELLKELDEIVKPEAVFASNTSSLSITEIGFGLKHEMVGMHFFNPVYAMKLLEIIRGEKTSDAAYEAALAFAPTIGKTPVSVKKEVPGFIVNRALLPMLNEACVIVGSHIGSVEDVDNGMKLGCNHPMGPLELADMIGLDILLNVMTVLHSEYGEKYHPSLLLRKMVRAGKLGRKTGEGFFKY